MESRLQILFDADILTKDVYHGMLNVVNKLEQQWKLTIRNSQGEMMITHMSNAMMRASRQSDIEPLNAAIFSEVQQSDIFAQLVKINDDLLSEFSFSVSENEKSYLLANLYGLYQAQSS